MFTCEMEGCDEAATHNVVEHVEQLNTVGELIYDLCGNCAQTVLDLGNATVAYRLGEEN